MIHNVHSLFYLDQIIPCMGVVCQHCSPEQLCVYNSMEHEQLCVYNSMEHEQLCVYNSMEHEQLCVYNSMEHEQLCVYNSMEHEIQSNHPELSSLSMIAISNRYLQCFKHRKEIFYSNVNSWRVVIRISTNVRQCFRNFVSSFSEKPWE